MGTSASHPNLSSILAAPSSPAQPSTGNGVQHAGLASPMSANELALLGLASPALTEHAPLRNRAVSTGNLADLYSQPVKVKTDAFGVRCFCCDGFQWLVLANWWL